MGDFRIEYLVDEPEHLMALAAWDFQEWGWLHPDRTIDHNIDWFKENMNRGELPCSLVALVGDTPAGMASFTKSDLPARPDLAPWLSSLYVDPQFRKNGIGGKLVARVCQEAAGQGFDRLYLHTLDREAFYTKLGWETIDHSTFFGEPATVMTIKA